MFNTVRLILSRSVPLVLGAALTHAALAQQAIELRPDRPERYTVVEGDTLWGIASRFLKDPWRWPAIWQANQQIENPHLIYPGDVLVLTDVGGQPQVRVLRKVNPSVRSSEIREPIPTIPPNAIQPFLNIPLVVSEPDLDRHGYVAAGLHDHFTLGKYNLFYARGLPADGGRYYNVYRPGRVLIHPDTQEVLGLQAVYLGDARMLADGDPARMEITRSVQEILPADRLVATPRLVSLPTYLPHAPDSQVRGRILLIENGVSEAGSLSIVVISLGTREGIEEGHVLRILRHQGLQRDPVTGKDFQLPDEDAGLLMVFRPFEKVSYALILKTTLPVHVLDAVETP